MTECQKKLRLILFEECDRSCRGCCNRDWDLASLPVCTDFSGYEQILLTGGEPMLHPELVEHVIFEIRKVSSVPIFMYTAKTDSPWKLYDLLILLDGITVTLHNKDDVLPFFCFKYLLEECRVNSKSLRLNVFKGVDAGNMRLDGWIVKKDITWIPNCPLPAGEVLMRIPEYLRGVR